MAGPDFLSQLPSLEELLEQPRVKAAVERLNQSTTATRVRTAVSSLSAEIAKRAEDLQTLAPSDLLDRLVRRISEPTPPPVGTQINATGEFFGPLWQGAPLPAATIEAMQAVAGGFRPSNPCSAAPTAKRVVACDASTVYSSPIAGLSVALEALAGGGAVIISRAEMTEIEKGVRLEAVCRRAGVTLREVGATDAATLADYEEAISQTKAQGGDRLVVLKRLSESAPQDLETTVENIAELCLQHQVPLLVEAGNARPRQDTPAYGDPLPSLQELLRAGADAVLARTAGRLGGPLGCLLVGNKQTVEVVEQSAASLADSIDPLTDAALAATLALFERPDTLRFSHPLHQLLDAPLENLRSRAERLAPQIAAADRVAEAIAEPVEGVGDRPGSWRVRVTDDFGDNPLPNSISLRQDDRSLLIDLRTVFPGQDRSIAAAFSPDPVESTEHPAAE